MRLILFLGGAAALGWQILWSHHLGLALGASARGVALTVATAMAGMTVGSLLCARFLKSRKDTRPVFLYGVLEIAIGALALLPSLAEPAIMDLDTLVHSRWPGSATLFTVLALAASIGPACIAMGATIPLMGLIARQTGKTLSSLYACNTAGAAAGTLATAFWLMPWFGLAGSATGLVGVHLSIAIACVGISRGLPRIARADEPDSFATESGRSRFLDKAPLGAALVFLSGFSAFLLEVSWFRLLRSAWFSTSDSLAVMLFCFLIALAAGAAIAPAWRRRDWPLSGAFALAALLVVISTQILGRFDLVHVFQSNGVIRQWSRVLAGLAVIGPPVCLLGIALPTLLDEARRPREWATLYAINTAGSVVGANLAAWLLMEWVGPLATAWIAGGALALAAWIDSRGSSLRSLSVAGFTILLAGMMWFDRKESSRIRGTSRSINGTITTVEQHHGPDSSVAAIAFDGGRALMINGFVTTAESSQISNPQFQYMDSIGRIPMLLHADPKDALVICFGTGQTAHAVRDEGPQRLDLVDLNPTVFKLGRHFVTNHRVLEDPRVHQHVMDGRSWLRRSGTDYDVITLEPMPPFFSGSNALYSTGFYRLVEKRLRPGGIVAQWFPIHLMTPEQSRSIAAAFVEVFPDAILWLDPGSVLLTGLRDQGILVGRKIDPESDSQAPLGDSWPGFEKEPESGKRNFTSAVARREIALDAASLARFVGNATPVTDDNLLLEYGTSPFRASDDTVKESIRRIHERIESARSGGTP